MVENWTEYLPYKTPMLRILQELSSIYSAGERFVIIGGFSLLVNCYLKFPCLWDIDILVPSRDNLRGIVERLPFEMHITGEMSDVDFSALSSLLRVENHWINVDVLSKDLFPFYERTKIILEKSIDGFTLRIPVGHPYAVLTDKVLTSRFGDALEAEDPFVYDVRHVGAILMKDADKEELWRFLDENLSGEVRKRFFERLRKFAELSGLGYVDEEVKEKVLRRLEKIYF
ncbi:MAG: hypothetical protein PWR13_376 [Archaeoglobi archaeon]|nr:hypothetical protein [Candidatus Mnemosynella bozhongmuii]MDK2781348.1 hypothetical protein [Archaeoglobi archaeon]